METTPHLLAVLYYSLPRKYSRRLLVSGRLHLTSKLGLIFAYPISPCLSGYHFRITYSINHRRILPGNPDRPSITIWQLMRKAFPSVWCPYQALFSICAFGRIIRTFFYFFSLCVRVQSICLQCIKAASQRINSSTIKSDDENIKVQSSWRTGGFLVVWYR